MTDKKKLLRRLLLIFLCICIVGALLCLGVNWYVKGTASKYVLTEADAALLDADCILVLGAGVRGESPSPMLEDRLLEGEALWKAGAAPKIIVSGDHGRTDYDEVNVMKRFMMADGIPSSDIFMDHAGFSTYESMYRARDIFQAKKVIIVTQGYHLYRAIYIARQLGLEAYGVASDPRAYSGQMVRDAREMLARIKDFGKCIFKPDPTYLGEAIPVSGDGDATND